MNIKNRVTRLLNVKYPIIQAGMVWVSGWELASAVSNAGGLGLIGAGSMKPGLLREHIQKCRSATENSFGVNIPLLRSDASELIDVVIKERVKIVFSSAGSPLKFIGSLKNNDIKVIHVVSTLKQGIKSQEAGCDAVVGEGVEAGGHNGPDEITTFCLIPQLADILSIPVIAAGGIADGRGIFAALALGAEGVQLGTRFAVTKESSAHDNYKKVVCETHDNGTVLILKKIGLTRLIKNEFSSQILEAEKSGAETEDLIKLVGNKREKLGIFEGNSSEGMMEAGQSSGLVNNIYSVKQLFELLLAQFEQTRLKTK